jgi:hypothetical protein
MAHLTHSCSLLMSCGAHMQQPLCNLGTHDMEAGCNKPVRKSDSLKCFNGKCFNGKCFNGIAPTR